MKNIIILAILLFSSLAVAAQTDKYNVTVEGLGCPFCAYGLEKKFKEVDGVKNIKIDIKTGLMTFTTDAAKSLTIEKIDNQVDKAGYTAKAIKIQHADGKVETSSNTTESTNTTSSPKENLTTETFHVSGNCVMCKTRIEKAVQSIEGVTLAEWNADSKMITVKFDVKKVSLNDIHNKIASVGHDTDQVKAKNDVYQKLPGCCLYERS